MYVCIYKEITWKLHWTLTMATSGAVDLLIKYIYYLCIYLYSIYTLYIYVMQIISEEHSIFSILYYTKP